MTTLAERPITELSEDLLGRAGFCRRLAEALIRPDGVRATGVVVGVTGPWGSGKSSVLNMVEAELRQRCPDAVVVRFDPWLVSGSDSLIEAFFEALLAALTPALRHDKKYVASRHAVYSYGKKLAPGLTGVPFVGQGLKAVAERSFGQLTSLDSLRKRLAEALEGLGVPVVVLVDELDRTEDAEIRTMAQVIRSIVDFPSVSYLLAFDEERVADALGNGSVGRGRAYLAKIVQRAIPLPIAERGVLRDLLEGELGKIAEVQGLVAEWLGGPRALELLDLLVPGVLQTPRAIKKLVGTFEVVLPMVQGEVEPVDLLGWCALEQEAPPLANAIRQKPQSVSRGSEGTDKSWGDFADEEAFRRKWEDNTGRKYTESSPDRLLGFLFSACQAYGESRPLTSDAAEHQAALEVILHFGLPRGRLARSELRALYKMRYEAAFQTLEDVLSRQMWTDLMASICHTFQDISDSNSTEFWRALAALWQGSQGRSISSTDYFCSVLSRSYRLDPSVQVAILDPEPPVQLLSLHCQIAYQLNRVAARALSPEDRPVNCAEEIDDKLRAMQSHLLERLHRGNLFDNLYGPYGLFLLDERGCWSEVCRRHAAAYISGDGMRHFASIFYEKGYGCDWASVVNLVDETSLQRRLSELDEVGGLDTYALKKMAANCPSLSRKYKKYY